MCICVIVTQLELSQWLSPHSYLIMISIENVFKKSNISLALVSFVSFGKWMVVERICSHHCTRAALHFRSLWRSGSKMDVDRARVIECEIEKGVLVVVHKIILELHSKTELQHSAKQLKQLETWYKTSDVSIQLICCDHSLQTTWESLSKMLSRAFSGGMCL